MTNNNRNDLKLGSMFGAPVVVNWGVAVLIIAITASMSIQVFPYFNPSATTTRRVVVATVITVLFLLSTLIHELAHALAARRYSIKLIEIRLSVFGGHAQLARQAPTPRAEWVIAAAGPLINLLIAAVIGIGTFLASQTSIASRIEVNAIAWLGLLNLATAVLNLIPVAPLDGGRILTAWLWKRHGDAEVARILSARAGIIFAFLLVTAGLWLTIRRGQAEGLLLIAVGIFLVGAARREVQTAVLRRRFNGITISELMTRRTQPLRDFLTVSQAATVIEPKAIVTSVKDWAGETIGYVTPEAMSSSKRAGRSSESLDRIMLKASDFPRVWATETVAAVDERLQGWAKPTRSLPMIVHDPSSGKEVGAVTRRDLLPLRDVPRLWGTTRKFDVTEISGAPNAVSPSVAMTLGA